MRKVLKVLKCLVASTLCTKAPSAPYAPAPMHPGTPGTPGTLGTLRSYSPQLDGLRALAVAAVAWSHWERPYEFGIPFGAGVHLFYVLSGFLITRILLAQGPFSLRGYSLRSARTGSIRDAVIAGTRFAAPAINSRRPAAAT